jgi:hypothetical protein
MTPIEFVAPPIFHRLRHSAAVLPVRNAMMKLRFACLAIVVLVPVDAVWAQAPELQGVEFFEKKIRPVLVQHCYSCHSAEAKSKKKLQARLYLDSQDGMLTGGETGPAIVKGKAADSLLIEALKFDGLEMPPTGKLPDEVIADFVKWIEMGAPDPRQGKAPAAAKREISVEEGRKFWSFQPLKKIEPPSVKNSAWVKTPIDQFAVAKHEELGLVPNNAASKEKLVRRIYFDLIGLPPTSEEVAAFVNDASPQAYSLLIDKLLASERHGERWGRHWLDVVRYAESGGYEFDGFRPGAYHYRDWVIKAINADMPFNEFVRMQLAGDKLMPDDFRGASAAGFLVAGPYPGQITAKTVERIRYDQIDDMLMTIGGSMLGLTLGCVRCHEHKYDPIPHQDYYGLAATLAQTVQGAKPYDPNPDATQQALEVHQREHAVFVAGLQRFANEELPKRFEAWRTTELPKQPETPRWQVLEPVTVHAERSWLKPLANGVVAHDGAITAGSNLKLRGRAARVAREAEEYTITTHTYQQKLTSVRLDAFTDAKLPKRGPGLNADGSFQLIEMKVTARPLAVGQAFQPDSQAGKPDLPPIELKWGPAYAAFEDKDQPIKNAIDGKPATAWVVKETAGKDNAAIFEIDGGLPGFANGTELTFELKFRDQGLGRIRLSISTEPNPATWAGDIAPQHLGEIRAILAAQKNVLPETLREPMTRWFSRFDTETAKAFETVASHAQREPRPVFTEVYTTVGGGQDVFFLRRGEVDNKQGKAEPAFVQVLFSSNDPGSRWLKSPGDKPQPVDPRVGLANWMTDVEAGAGHLLARVIVNRLWQHHFGEGLVATPNDFGAQGDRPTHPELLDWLAGELIANGWKLKPLHKLMMTSAVYMQGNEVSPANLKADPDNRFHWYHKPQRLEAEIIRDALLSVGGSLDQTMYGPSILDNTPRRSVYLRVKRSELIPLMTMFDAPEPTQSIGERGSTTVPTQALTMMNAPFVRQQAEKLAARVRVAKEESFSTAIDRAYQIAFARMPTDSERSRMLTFVEQQRPALGDNALAEFCQVLLCLNEFVYVD